MGSKRAISLNYNTAGRKSKIFTKYVKAFWDLPVSVKFFADTTVRLQATDMEIYTWKDIGSIWNVKVVFGCSELSTGRAY